MVSGTKHAATSPSLDSSIRRSASRAEIIVQVAINIEMPFAHENCAPSYGAIVGHAAPNSGLGSPRLTHER